MSCSSRRLPALIALLSAALATWAFAPAARAAGNAGEQAPEFPPGSFSDGGQYKMSDFQGKVLVIFLYEQDCPKCRGEIPERNKVVEQFKGKPVKFIAVGAGDSLPDVMAYVRGTRLEMPSFADTFGVMEKRYGQHISLKNIYHFRVINPEGKIVGYDMKPETIEAALQNVKWKYKDAGYDPRLNGVIDLLEWNQYEPAVRQLKPLMKASKGVGESATKLMEAVKAEGKGWLDEADKAKESDPIQAYDLYARVASVFPGDDMAKTADAAMKALKADKAVADELAARAMYQTLNGAMTKATLNQRAQVVAYCQQIAKKYPNAPAAKKATDLAQEIQDEATVLK
jgi:peroxiredoxin